MNIGDLIMRVLINDKGFDADLQKTAQKSGDKAGKTLGAKLSAGLKSPFKGGKGELLGMLGLGAGIGVAAVGLSKLIDFMGDSVAAASNLNEAMTKSEAVFKDGSEEMEAWAETASTAFGQSKRQALEAAGTFGNLIQAFGEGSEKSAEMSKRLVELASDLASFNNTSVDDAIVALRSGLSGETEPLKRYGIALSDARMRTELMAQGVTKLGATLTPLQKTQAAYALILKDSTLAQGDFSRTSDGLANMQKTLSARMEDVSAELGEKLLPLMLTMSEWAINDGVPALEAFIEALGAVGEFFEDTGLIATDSMADLVAAAEAGSKNAQTALRQIGKEARGAGTGVAEFGLTWEEVADDFHQGAESAREAGRGIGVVAASAEDAEEPVKDIGETGRTAGELLEKAAKQAAKGWRDYAAQILQLARGKIETAYQIIEDRAALAAANVETAELRKVIATGKATQEQKADYIELGETQALLLLDLAENGIKSGKEVATATAQMRERLETASGQERKAILALLEALNRVSVRARSVRGQINALIDSGTNLFAGPGFRGRAHGGPVSAGQTYIVGEHRPELFVPKVDGTILPKVPSMAGATSTVTNNYPTLNVQGALPVRTIRDVSIEMQRISAGVTPSRQLSPQYDRGEV